jgi:hypothetical protein
MYKQKGSPKGFQKPLEKQKMTTTSTKIAKTAKRKRKLSFSALRLPWSLQPLVSPSLRRGWKFFYFSLSKYFKMCRWLPHWNAFVQQWVLSLPPLPTKMWYGRGRPGAVTAGHWSFPKKVFGSKPPLRMDSANKDVSSFLGVHCRGHSDLDEATPLFCRFCAVRILSCIRIQAKILHLFSAFALQISSLRKYRKDPLNWIR